MNELDKKYLTYLALTPIKGIKGWLTNLPKSLSKPIKPTILLRIATVFFIVMMMRRGIMMILVSLLLLLLAWSWKVWVAGDWRREEKVQMPPLK